MVINRVHRIFRPWLCITILCLLTSACSTTFFYRHLDWLLIRFVEGYVELNTTQKQHIRSDLAQINATLEQSVLPDLQALLERLARDNEQGRMGDNLEQYMLQFETLFKRTAKLAEPGIVVLALSLDNEQKNQFFDELERRNEKFQRKYIAKGEAHARNEHLRELRKNTKKWLGKIGAEQNLALQVYDANYRANEQGWLESRQRWQAELKRVLNMGNVDAKSARLSKLLLQPQDYWTSAYKSVADDNRAVSIALTQQLAAHMDAGQRSKFARQLTKNQKKVANFAQAIATTKPQEIAGQQSSPSVATATLQPVGLPRTAYSH
ncbi:MAG: DUF6279 family lipoprotein [Pseudomonadales bacterium]